jgi:serine/threonine protein kinase
VEQRKKLGLGFYGTPGQTKWEPSPWCADEGLDLARGLLQPEPEDRLTFDEALQHPFLQIISST